MTKTASDRVAEAPTAGYDRLGEFHDLFVAAARRRLRPALAAAFGGLRPDAVVLDLGAGTGLGVRQLAQATRARVVAVEPSVTMRAVLLARLADDPELTSRVTVVAGSVPDAFDELPEEVAGFVCAHMLGHVSPADRALTFSALAARLAGGGVGVVTVNATAEPRSEAVVEERRIGEHRYIARYLPAGADGRPSSEYEVRDADGRLLRAERFPGHWTPITPEGLRAELVPAGWRVTTHDHAATVLMLSREPGRGR
ncbi:MAG: class I SAM-dependent methyltransferase [Trueperaceae bacterium]|nr:class I SAM-dependent methyltransferase [Trueperaceae bacterium]